jgi:membrane fusion protein (multidrug efflux system)
LFFLLDRINRLGGLSEPHILFGGKIAAQAYDNAALKVAADELVLASGNKFDHLGKIGAIEADFNNETGNIPFRADFPNPDRLLRHGQTGNVLIHRVVNDAIVIPQRATFETLAKRYVYVVDKDDVVHQREIDIQNELDDIFVIKSGLEVNDKIVLEGVRQVREGEKVECEFRKPEEALANQKHHAE